MRIVLPILYLMIAIFASGHQAAWERQCFGASKPSSFVTAGVLWPLWMGVTYADNIGNSKSFECR